MRDSLRFVRGAVATKDLVPILTHFHIYDNGKKIQGFNGRICIDHPFHDQVGDFTVHAERFIKAVDACGGEPEIVVQDNGRIKLTRNNFTCRLAVETVTEFPVATLPGQRGGEGSYKLASDFISNLKIMLPFISDDATRDWSMSIKIERGQAFATNNVSLIKVPFQMMPDCLLSGELVAELIRIGKVPRRVIIDEKVTAFEYSNGAWIKGINPAGEWPDLSSLFTEDEHPPIPTDMFKAVETLKPFAVAGQAVLTLSIHPDKITTNDAEVDGFKFDLEEPVHFQFKPVLDLLKICDHGDFSLNPQRPSEFYGDNVRVLVAHVTI